MKFIIFGPPGSGKGTYASRICPRLEIAHIATGDIFRGIVKGEEDSPLALGIQSFMSKGALVPDDLVILLLKQELEKPGAKNGFVLDGFPRTVEQARILEEITPIDAVLSIKIPQEILIAKISARRTCRECGNIYNIADIQREIDGVQYNLPPMLPKIEGKCDKCGGELIQRADDVVEIVKNRLETYENQSRPVLDYYKGKIPFVEIYVTQDSDTVSEQILKDLKEVGFANGQESVSA